MRVKSAIIKEAFGKLPPSAKAEVIASLWTKWDTAVTKYFSLADEVLQYLYATSTTDTTNVSNGHDHTTHNPKLTQIYDNLKANYRKGLFTGPRWFDFVGSDLNSMEREKTLKVNKYLELKHKQNGFFNVVDTLIDDFIIYGNAFAQVEFGRNTHQVPNGVASISYQGPVVRRISPRDIRFDCTGADFVRVPKVVREIMDLGEFFRYADEVGDGWDEEVVNHIRELRRSLHGMPVDAINKYAQINIDGFGSAGIYYNSGSLEILRFYGDFYSPEEQKLYKNYEIVVVDRQYILAERPLNTLTGFPHIYHVGWRNRVENLWGMGPLDNLVGMQYMIDHLANAKADAFDQMLAPDRVIAGDVIQRKQRPDGGIDYVVPERGQVYNLAPDTTVLNADLQIQVLERSMEKYAGAPEETLGIRSPGEKTKFEVQNLSNRQENLFQQKLETLDVLLENILNAELEVSISERNTIDVLRTSTDEGYPILLTITKDDLVVNGRIYALGAANNRRKQRIVQDLASFINLTGQDPEVRQHFAPLKIAQLLEQLLEFEEYNLVDKFSRITEQGEAQLFAQTVQKEAQSAAGVDTEALINGVE